MSKVEETPLLAGVYAALATPRSQNVAEADAAALFDYLDAMAATGLDGFVLFGSTGEFIHFGIEERMRVAALARKRSRLPMLVNVSHSTLTGAIDLAVHAIGSGASGLLLMPPYFYRYTGGQIAEFYRVFAKEIGGKARLYLYNIPKFTSAIPAEVCEELLRDGLYSGIKDSSGDWPLCERLLQARRETPFQFVVGSDSIYCGARALGADGIVSGVAAAVPELLVALDRALQTQSTAQITSLNQRLTEFLSWTAKFPTPICIKLAANARGWKFANSAIPFDAATKALQSDFEAWFTPWLEATLVETRAMRA